jgi:hypothetical protein
MPFIGNKPSAVPLTSADIADGIITSAKIVDATIANADIANSTINLTTKVTGTLPVANGGTGLTALGTSLQVLRTNSGATALEFASASSDYVLLATTTASSSSSISFDGYYSATYKNYYVVFNNVVPATNTANFKIRFRRSNADITASNYKGGGGGTDVYSAEVRATFVGFTWSNDSCKLTEDITNVANRGGVQGYVNIFDPLETSTYKRIDGALNYWNNGSGVFLNVNFGYTLEDATTALSGITFYFSSGNIASGTFKLYGLK